jgi:hypothetical protein
MATFEGVRFRLAAAVRFEDAFTLTPIDVPLDVRVETLPVVKSMPMLPWRATHGLTDKTYRFWIADNTAGPVGPVAVVVTDARATRAEYVDFEGFSMVLPRPLTAHPPTPAATDYLIKKTLWPTRVSKVPPGETAIVATVKSAGANLVEALRLKVWTGGGAPPATPYTYTNAAGEALFRLPDLKTLSGGVISLTANVELELRLPPTYATAVVPTQIRDEAGVVLPSPFALRLGQITTLQISIP